MPSIASHILTAMYVNDVYICIYKTQIFIHIYIYIYIFINTYINIDIDIFYTYTVNLVEEALNRLAHLDRHVQLLLPAREGS